MKELSTTTSPMSASEIQQQVNVIQTIMQQVMIEGVHYGTIPGCGDKPALLKAGAEKIMSTFRLSADPIVNDLSSQDEARFRIKVNLTSPTGDFLGAGIGECSSNEDKYKWRACYIKIEFDATPENRRRIKYSQYRNGPVKAVDQVRTNPADQANTVLKMAKKRALVDAVLTVTAASDLFSQDIEDIPREIVNDYEPRNERPANPRTVNDYPADKFDELFPSWVTLITSGTNTAKQIMSKLSSKGRLTENQKQRLENIGKEN